MTVPAFAVVGHPNKGKSSLVATLSQDDSVLISTRPGTTVKARRFPMKVDGEILYELIDTPGFQRAHKTLAWLRQHESDIHQRPEVVRKFVETFHGSGEFFDECELLMPIIEGAGILYVVDGSRPYGSEFEAEMEILRWTGQPNMALINLIGSGDHVDQWHKSLLQFFQIVRVFNAVTAEFNEHLELLRAFGQLNREWRDPLDRAVRNIQLDHEKRRGQSARLITEMIADCIDFTLTVKMTENNDEESRKTRLRSDFFARLQEKEQQCRVMIQKVYHYHHINSSEDTLKLLDDDLFSEQTWSIFGLSQQELIMTGVAGGAATGAVIDVAVGGASLLLGAGLGALIGGAGAMLSFHKLAQVRMLGMPLGGQALQIGPIQNHNFPYVLLARSLMHHQLIENRTHAMRDKLMFSAGENITGASRIPPVLRKQLETCFSKLRKEGSNSELVSTLASLVSKCMEHQESGQTLTNL